MLTQIVSRTLFFLAFTEGSLATSQHDRSTTNLLWEINSFYEGPLIIFHDYTYFKWIIPSIFKYWMPEASHHIDI